MDSPSGARRSLDDAIGRMLHPRSVALVGASPTPGSLGASVLANLERSGFAGAIHLVNPRRAEIGGRPCVPTAAALPPGVDCAVLAIPGSGVLDAMRDCAAAGVASVIIFSAGFAEDGPEGLARQEEIASIARAHGMAVEGPNCLGMVNHVHGIPLTFIDMPPPRFTGRRGIAIVSQSGAMAAVVGTGFSDRGLDVTYSVSTGNEAMLGVEDFLRHVLDDPHTDVVVLVVETFRQPRRFLLLAQEARARGKHIVLLHPGRSAAARLSALTHTGALAGNDAVMRVMVRDAGVMLVERLEQLLDVSDLLVRCPRPACAATAVITESGAFKALALDHCEELGLPLPAPCEATAAALRRAMPAFIPPSNPMDLTAQALMDADLYRRAMEALLADDAYGSLVLAIILTNEATSRHKLPAILGALASLKPHKPVLFAAMDEGAVVPPAFIDALRTAGVPFFPSPERAFIALSLFAALPRPRGEDPVPALPAGPGLPAGVMPEHRSKQVLREAGIRVPPGEFVTDARSAQDAATRIGFPVALKAQSAALSHKSDAGGVVLNLTDRDAVRDGWERMHRDLAAYAPGLQLDGVLVEGMAARGTELIVGARNDRDWGAVVLVGLGGIWAEALHDVRLLSPGLSQAEVEAELLCLKGAALLRGVRGSPPLDVAAAADIVCRIGRLVVANPEIAEIDVNPVVVYPAGQGALALDGLIVVAPR